MRIMNDLYHRSPQIASYQAIDFLRMLSIPC